ncbi:MAG TPA: zf-HC2 domain-containing protein [Vicinamibacterales bacterium]|nr:zf-HC2 domain-containing protein [Vicinamibacterales bacterium]
MACQQYLNSVHELVDGTIGAIRRAELEQHLDGCDACRALVSDLQRIRDAAGALPEMRPPDRVWLQIAGRLRQEGRITTAAEPERTRHSYVAWLAIAAALVIAAGGAVMLLIPRPTTPSQSAAPAAQNSGAPVRSVETVQNEVDAAQQQFEKAISELEKVAKANQQALDPGTSATIEKNLGIIDQAIAENRAAVKSEPASVAARETLFDALRQKVSLLQDTISLINEMRKGNNAGAAQLVNKS